mgnify:FL=1
MTTSDWRQRSYPVGTRVIVLDLDGNRMGGELLTAYDSDSRDNKIPRIRSDDGKEWFGYECWWIPIDELCETTITTGPSDVTFTCTSEELK